MRTRILILEGPHHTHQLPLNDTFFLYFLKQVRIAEGLRLKVVVRKDANLTYDCLLLFLAFFFLAFLKQARKY